MTPTVLTCVVRNCGAERAKDSDRCVEHRWQQWTGRTPEWVLRAQRSALVAKDYSGQAA